MAKQKARDAGEGGAPKGNAAQSSRSGQGSGSALREMLRRQLQNPSTPPHGNDKPRTKPTRKGS
jgi:hypothetical protein